MRSGRGVGVFPALGVVAGFEVARQPRNPLQTPSAGNTPGLPLPSASKPARCPRFRSLTCARSSWNPANSPRSRARWSTPSPSGLANGEQAMLMLNRRGFSSFVACRGCGDRWSAPTARSRLPTIGATNACCATIAATRRRSPSAVPNATATKSSFSRRQRARGAGAARRVPSRRVARLDRDTVGAKRDYETILTGFREHHYDSLSTQ